MSRSLKPTSCTNCPLYEQDVFVPGGFTTSDVIIMSDCPPPFGGHFTSKGETLVKGVVNKLAEDEKELGKEDHLQKFKSQVQYMYSTLCYSESLKKDQVEYCRDSQVINKIMASKAKVILCLGSSLATFFDLSRITEKDLRGMQVDYRLPNGKTVKLIFSVSVLHFLKSPGLYTVLAGDIKRASKALAHILTPKIDIWSLESKYDIATDLDDIKTICAEYQSYSAGSTTCPVNGNVVLVHR